MSDQTRHPNPSTKGLVAHYKLWAGLTSATKVFDYSLNGFTGVPAGNNIAPAYPGFKFDGTSDSINVANDPLTIKTVAIWANPNDIAGADYLIDLNDADYFLINTGTFSMVGFDVSEITYVDGVAGNSVTSNWHLLVGTFAVAKDATSLAIGRKTGSPWFGGLIGETWLYNRVLPPDEIKSLYELTKWRYPNNN
jgi:hypothetical protein